MLDQVITIVKQTGALGVARSEAAQQEAQRAIDCRDAFASRPAPGVFDTIGVPVA
jgi:hypothetical protein